MAERATLDSEPNATTEPAGEVDSPSETIRPPDAGIPMVIPRSAKTLLWQARAGLAIGILGFVVALVLFLQSADLRQEAATRQQVLDAGELIAARVTTYEGSDIEAWVADTQSLSTTDYAAEVASEFPPEVRQGLTEANVSSVGEVLSSFVQEIDGDRATVFAVLRQTYTSSLRPEQISDELRMEIGLQRQDDAWLADSVLVLGPSVFSPIDQDGAAGSTAAPEDGG